MERKTTLFSNPLTPTLPSSPFKPTQPEELLFFHLSLSPSLSLLAFLFAVLQIEKCHVSWQKIAVDLIQNSFFLRTATTTN
jgi:hypothetical protein